MGHLRVMWITAVVLTVALAAPAVAAPAVRPGEVLAVPLALQPSLSRQNVTVVLVPATGLPLVAEPGALVRAVVTLFPDPVSRLAVSNAQRAQEGDAARSDGANTVVYVALPETVPTGPLTVILKGSDGRVLEALGVEVVAGDGVRPEAGDLSSLERAEHQTIALVGMALPHSLQIVLAYERDSGRPVVVNPRPAAKNLVWSDDGASVRVLITPTSGRTPTDAEDYKFHVAGGVRGLRVVGVTAYDVNGLRIAGLAVTVE